MRQEGTPDNRTVPEASTYDWENHRFTDRAVLCFIERDGEYLLIHKKRGLGAGKINAPGGRLEAGETPVEAAARETREEVGVDPSGLSHRGDLSFIFTDGYSLFVSVFTADGFSGTLTETDEALPFWCPAGEIPYGRMWADDRLWLPLMLEGRRFKGYFVFDGDRMLSEKLVVDP